MALTEYVIMPGSDYQDICNAVREKTGGTELLKSGEIAGEVREISTGVDEQDIIESMAMDSLVSGDITINSSIIERRTFSGRNKITSVKLPNAINIYEYAFDSCAEIKSIELDLYKGLQARNGIFSNCTALSDVCMPEYIAMNYYMFSNCTALEKLKLDKCESINLYSLQNCTALKIVDIYGGYIGSAAFVGSTSLKTVVLRRTDKISPLNLSNAFTNTPFASNGSGGTVYCPEALISEFQKATNWSVLYEAGTCIFRALEDYTVDGTTTGEMDWDKIEAEEAATE